MTDTEMIYSFLAVLASSSVIAFVLVLIQIAITDKD